MCVRPKKLTVGGEAVEVACKHCWRCRAQRKWDYVGRAIAESEICGPENIRCVTLTYGNSDKMADVPKGPERDEPRKVKKGAKVPGLLKEFKAVSIVKRDARLWVKRIREDGYNCRYMLASEFGPKKGRVHWHAILFFYPPVVTYDAEGRPKPPKVKTIVPPVLLNKRLRERDQDNPALETYWDEGLTFWQPFHVGSAMYILKYMLKSAKLENRLVKSETEKHDEADRTGWMTCSKKPPLGAAYFKQRAEKYVEAGLSPQDLIYTFPEVKRGDGTPRKFFVGKQSKTAALFLNHYLQEWKKRYPGRHYPASELVDEHIDGTGTQRNRIANHADTVGKRKTPSTLRAELANAKDHQPGEALRLGRKGKGLSVAERKRQQDGDRYRSAMLETQMAEVGRILREAEGRKP